MKVIKEIGSKKALKFLIYSLLQIFYSFMIFPPLRKIFLVILGSRIGTNSVLMNVKMFNWYHRGPRGLKIGRECFIGDEALLDLYSDITLEDQVTIAPRVTVLTHTNVGYQDHPLQKFFPKSAKPVLFRNGCVIGGSATILPGVEIGKNSFVAAGSVVVKDVPQNTLVAGVPAKELRRIK